MEVTFTNRDTMQLRMLLGREAISNDMIVNLNQTSLKNELSYNLDDNLKKKLAGS